MQQPRQPLPPEARSIVDWLIEGAPGCREPQDVLDEVCRRLIACGLSLQRVAVFVRTLHPNVMGRRMLWRPGEAVQVTEASYDFLATDGYLSSPVAEVFRTRRPVRCLLERPDSPDHYGIIEELRAEGVTDYLIQPLGFSNGEIHAVSWTTCRPGGFSAEDLAVLDALCAPFSRLAEIYALRRTASTLLGTYVGRGAGERILKGHIRRGDIENIPAAIVASDLRGFTELSNRLTGDAVVRLLNSYFDGLVPPIEAHGGEVLKFIGDGLLAIFPTGDDRASQCRAALAAVAEARAALGAANQERLAHGGPALQTGFALNVGEVHYGNVGSSARLDFTAIGPAVNLTARLEKLGRDLGREVVLSAAFAAQVRDPVVSLGRFPLRGFHEPQEVFAPASSPHG